MIRNSNIKKVKVLTKNKKYIIFFLNQYSIAYFILLIKSFSKSTSSSKSKLCLIAQ